MAVSLRCLPWRHLIIRQCSFWFCCKQKWSKVRTRDLEETLEQNKQLEHAARKDRERLMQLEKGGNCLRTFSIIAHEARQPVTSLINYSNGLSLYLKGKNDSVIDRATH